SLGTPSRNADCRQSSCDLRTPVRRISALQLDEQGLSVAPGEDIPAPARVGTCPTSAVMQRKRRGGQRGKVARLPGRQELAWTVNPSHGPTLSFEIFDYPKLRKGPSRRPDNRLTPRAAR